RRPRASVAMPAAARFRSLVAPTRPVLDKALSVMSSLPLARRVRTRFTPFAQMVDQAFDNLRVDEVEQPRAHIDKRHPHAKRREHARVLAADDAGADYREGARELVELHHVVAGKDVVTVERSARIAGRMSADGQHDGRGGNFSLQTA